jgi:hypothetical protein
MHSKRGYNYNSEKSKVKEAKNSPTEVEVVRPQALDQSYKESKNNSMILAKGVSLFLKVRPFLSLQIVHIRHAGIKRGLKHAFTWFSTQKFFSDE